MANEFVPLIAAAITGISGVAIQIAGRVARPDPRDAVARDIELAQSLPDNDKTAAVYDRIYERIGQLQHQDLHAKRDIGGVVFTVIVAAGFATPGVFLWPLGDWYWTTLAVICFMIAGILFAVAFDFAEKRPRDSSPKKGEKAAVPDSSDKST